MTHHVANDRLAMRRTALMRHALRIAGTARRFAHPNPWVGAVIECADGQVFDGVTQAPGGAHAEIMALRAAAAAGASTVGATLYSTLEPCNHTGRTGPCTEAIIDAGVSTVVVGITDPDTKVAGTGIARMRSAGIDVVTGLLADEVGAQLRAYVHHRTTGRPWVVLKMATTLDARTVAPAGDRWITGAAARERVHEIRAESDAIVVGANTVMVDDPELTVRGIDGPSPRRVVLARNTQIPASARVQPCTVWQGDPQGLLESLGRDNVVQLMVEGGPTVAGAFHNEGLVNEYVFHVAPVVNGSVDAPGVFDDVDPHPLAHHRIVSTRRFGDDLEVVMQPAAVQLFKEEVPA